MGLEELIGITLGLTAGSFSMIHYLVNPSDEIKLIGAFFGILGAYTFAKRMDRKDEIKEKEFMESRIKELIVENIDLKCKEISRIGLPSHYNGASPTDNYHSGPQ